MNIGKNILKANNVGSSDIISYFKFYVDYCLLFYSNLSYSSLLFMIF